MHTVCAVPGGVTPHQLTFTIPEMLLDSPRLDHRIPDKLHVRMRLGIVGGGISGDDVEWDDWTNPLADDNQQFDLHPRVLDDHGNKLSILAPITILSDSNWERDYIQGDAQEGQEPGQLRHFTIIGLLPSCDNPIMKRLGLARFRVQVQVGLARGFAWADKRVGWLSSRGLVTDVPNAEVPEILTALIGQAGAKHGDSLREWASNKLSDYLAESAQQKRVRAEHMAEVTRQAKAMQQRLWQNNLLLPLATNRSAAARTLYGMLQERELREGTLRDLARWLLACAAEFGDGDGELPQEMMLGDRGVALQPARPVFVSMRAAPMWATGYNFMAETEVPTMAGGGEETSANGDQLENGGLWSISMPADCPFVLTIVLDLAAPLLTGSAPGDDLGSDPRPLDLVCRCVDSAQPLAKFVDASSVDALSSANAQPADGAVSAALRRIPSPRGSGLCRFEATLSFSRLNPRTHPARPGRPVLEPGTRLVLQLAAVQHTGGEAAWCTIDVRVQRPMLLHTTTLQPNDQGGAAAISEEGQNNTNNARPASECQPPPWQDLWRLLPQEASRVAHTSFNRWLIDHYVSERQLKESDPERFDSQRGPLLGWLLIFVVKGDTENRAKRARVGSLIDSGHIEAAAAMDTAAVVVWVSTRLCLLYGSLFARTAAFAVGGTLLCLLAIAYVI